MAALSGFLLLLLVNTGNALECLFCLNANQHLDHCHPITCSGHEECFFERTVDVDTYNVLHNAGCRDRTLCRYITMLGQGTRRRRNLLMKRGDIMTSSPVEYRSCYDCCDTPGISGQPCNVFLCSQNSTSVPGH